MVQQADNILDIHSPVFVDVTMFCIGNSIAVVDMVQEADNILDVYGSILIDITKHVNLNILHNRSRHNGDSI